MLADHQMQWGIYGRLHLEALKFDTNQRGWLYLSFGDIGLDDVVNTFGYIRDDHFSIEQADNFIINVFFDAQELFETVIDKKRKVYAKIAPLEQCDHLRHSNIRIDLCATV